MFVMVTFCQPIPNSMIRRRLHSVGPAVVGSTLGVALSLGTLVVGLVTSPGIFKVGVALLIAMLGEWLIQNWSDRASSDPSL